PSGAVGVFWWAERCENIPLPERAGLAHGDFPKLQTSVEARARAAGGELGIARIEPVVLADQVLAERIADGLVIVEAAVQPFDMLRRHHVEKVLVEVGADDLSA